MAFSFSRRYLYAAVASGVNPNQSVQSSRYALGCKDIFLTNGNVHKEYGQYSGSQMLHLSAGLRSTGAHGGLPAITAGLTAWEWQFLGCPIWYCLSCRWHHLLLREAIRRAICTADDLKQSQPPGLSQGLVLEICVCSETSTGPKTMHYRCPRTCRQKRHDYVPTPVGL